MKSVIFLWRVPNMSVKNENTFEITMELDVFMLCSNGFYRLLLISTKSGRE